VALFHQLRVTRPRRSISSTRSSRPRYRYCCCTPLSWPLLRHRYGDDDGFR